MLMGRNGFGVLAAAWLFTLAPVRADEPPQPQSSPYAPLPTPSINPPASGDSSALVPTGAEGYIPPVPFDTPLGFTGRSSVVPRTGASPDFIPMEDRWRIGLPAWDRYNKEHPPLDDYPYELGDIRDPFNQNVLKGDFPIIGQHTFLNVTATSLSVIEARMIPTATTPFESTARPFQDEFFGRPNQFFYSQFFFLSADLFHGDAAFKPVDWRLKITPAFDVNYLSVEELGIVSPDVRKGTTRARTWLALQEWFGEVKLADLSPEYDFISLRVGSQPFNSDFRGFIFADTNRAVRLVGTLNGNRDQFNLIYFDMQEKDTNSGLNTFEDRHQNVAIANWYHQDFIWPGYTIQGSVHYDNDGPSTRYDKNNFLVRPDPAGVFTPHRVEAVYLGLAGDGHIERYNITHALYYALGHDSRNPIANTPQDISAVLAALELSYDRDWARFRVSGFWSSGDGDVNNRHATGFDGILDQVNFAGSEFSYFGRQGIPLFGVQTVQRQSLFPDLRSSKIQGQANFVNPGLWLVNLGLDLEVTPKLRVINNANFMWFDKTNVLETFLFQNNIDREIGVDLSVGVEYRPLLSNNVIVTCGAATLLPASGFKQIYNRLTGHTNPLAAAFVELTLTY
jgi:hypothetical protein